MPPTTALQRALGGRTVNVRTAHLSRKVQTLQSSASRAREASRTVGTMVIHDVESVGTLAASCALEGRYGADKYKVKGVDVRGVGGLMLMALGGWRSAKRKKDGGHIHAVGLGLTQSVVAGAAVRWGARMADTAAQQPAQQPQQQQLPDAGQQPVSTFPGVAGDSALGAFLREVRLEQDSGLRPANRV